MGMTRRSLFSADSLEAQKERAAEKQCSNRMPLVIAPDRFHETGVNTLFSADSLEAQKERAAEKQ